MNISITNYEDLASEFSSETTFEKRSTKKDASSNRRFSKRTNGPKQFNGMHRRRTKKIKW